jgi:excisionase family DNA binding protein
MRQICMSGSYDELLLVVSPRRARRMLDCGNTRLYELIAARELESFKDGRSRKITVTSIKAYIARRLDESR